LSYSGIIKLEKVEGEKADNLHIIGRKAGRIFLNDFYRAKLSVTVPTRIGRYEIRTEIGRGGMATVYLAYDPRFKRNVALKVLPRQFTHDPTFRFRFEREAQTIASLEHYAIVPVYDFGEEDDQPYLVMRHMPGGSLIERIKASPLTPGQVAPIVQRIASALDEAHKHGIIHRDLKPGNILFDQYNKPYLSDFGIVKLTEATTTFTGTAVIGTPAYMSPEQGRGDTTIDGRSDIYALGAILFEMLTGKQPYEADTPMGVVIKHLTEPVPHILEVKTDLPAACDTLIQRAMAKQAAERYASAAELAEAVTIVADKGSLPSGHIPAGPNTDEKTSPPEVKGIAWKRATYPRWLWLPALGIILVCAMGAGVYATGLFGQPTMTATPTATTEPAIPAVATTIAPSPTLTAVPPSTLTPTAPTTNSPTPTSTPTLTATPTQTATATRTASPSSLPIPQLIAPLSGQLQSPITFRWTAVSGVSYRVTLRHLERDIVYTSDLILGSEWTFNIPAINFGNWEWFVTAVGGQSSAPANFNFNPFPGSGSAPTSTVGAATPIATSPPLPTDTPEPTVYP
jgi:serine/threonine-protein kinase